MIFATKRQNSKFISLQSLFNSILELITRCKYTIFISFSVTCLQKKVRRQAFYWYLSVLLGLYKYNLLYFNDTDIISNSNIEILI